MKSTKDEILLAIKKNLPEEKTEIPEIPDFGRNIPDLLDAFKENLTLAAGTFHEVNDEIEANKLLHTLFLDAKVICSATPRILGNKNIHTVKDPHELADVDVGVVQAHFGIAENGMVWITQEDLKINALGFLSQHLVILLDKNNLVKDLYEAYRKIDLSSTHYGCFMLGPSATADIGAVMIRGAQGARSLTVFFLPD